MMLSPCACRIIASTRGLSKPLRSQASASPRPLNYCSQRPITSPVIALITVLHGHDNPSSSFADTNQHGSRKVGAVIPKSTAFGLRKPSPLDLTSPSTIASASSRLIASGGRCSGRSWRQRSSYSEARRPPHRTYSIAPSRQRPPHPPRCP